MSKIVPKVSQDVFLGRNVPKLARKFQFSLSASVLEKVKKSFKIGTF